MITVMNTEHVSYFWGLLEMFAPYMTVGKAGVRICQSFHTGRSGQRAWVDAEKASGCLSEMQQELEWICPSCESFT